MGTSGPTSGSGSQTPLVPSWLGGDDYGALPCGDDSDGQTDADQAQQGADSVRPDRPPLPPIAPPERFRGARTNFSRFASSGGSDGKALRRAVRDYVRSGTGSSQNAARRMGSSRSAASNALGVFRGIQRDGLGETLRRLNLEALTGRGVDDVFIGLTEIICEDGGSIDEATARHAWLETVADIDSFDIEDLDALTADQIGEVFLTFIAHSIETRLYQEIGVNGFKFAEDVTDTDTVDRQLRDYISRGVRDSFNGDFASISDMTDIQIKDIVERSYIDAWDLLQVWGDQEE